MGQFTRDNLSYWARTLAAPFAQAFPINDAVSRTISPVMIIGCGRSGNTLLRSMLVRGGEVAIPPESYVWPTIARGYSRWRYSPWITVVEYVVDAFQRSEFGLSPSDLSSIKRHAMALAQKERSLAAVLNLIYESYCNLNGFSGRRWGDKTPLNVLDIRAIEGIFPASQYIHIFRDPRAVALSTVKAARTSPGIRESTFADSARRWTNSVRNARALGRRVGSKRYHEVRYEDLVSRPEEVLTNVCRFLGQSYTREMLSFYEMADMLGDVPAHSHHARIYTPVDPGRSKDWEQEISKSDKATVDCITSRYRLMLGYV